ncbi:MAG: VOC family protein [Parvularculaceae bacterium]|nr:VOC family protein [Parvularculaceae bacterium]
MRLALVAFLVRDYDEAIAWFTQMLGFALVDDAPLGDGKRWVVVAAPDGGARLLLARASTEEQAQAVGRQAGGRVGWFLETDDFACDHAAMIARGIVFAEAPRREAYGSVAVFFDLYGGRWDLVERR